MVRTVLHRYFTSCVLAGAVGLTLNGLVVLSAPAQPNHPIPVAQNRQGLKTEWDAFQPPVRGVPGRREGGGTRGPLSCPSGVNKLTALIPASTLGRTVLEKPSILYYVPVALNQTLVELELANEAEEVIYTTSFKLSNPKPGIVQVNLADKQNAPALKSDQNYHWYLTIRCDTDSPDASSDITVHGWINRVALNSSQISELEQAAPRDRLSLYEEKGLWYDMLSTLAELRSENPGNSELTQKWSELLNSVGLEKITQEPMVAGQLVPQN
ncbi:MAG: DUF928 domain-containing protein [Microcoleaceae cyanobacterium]